MTPAGGEPPRSPLRRGPWWARAVAAGLLIAAALPPWGWWPLAFVGLALWVELLACPSPAGRAARSAVVAACWLTPGTVWMVDLTAPGWPVAVAVFSAMFAAVGLLVPADDRRWLAFGPAVLLIELVRWNWPFGGTPIATLAMGQAAGPLAPTARLFGSPLLTLSITTLAVAVAAVAARRRLPALIAAVALAGALVGAAVAPGGHTVGALAVALVQGGGPQNTRADTCENRAVFERHLAASELVETPVDLVVWPEDVVHPSRDGAVTPQRCPEPLLTETEAADRLADLAARLDAIVVVGYFRPADDLAANENFALAIAPDGSIVDRYDKVRTVPFGEFVPLRGLIESFSSEIPGRDVRPGTEPAVLETPIGVLGVSISWEVFFDHRARDAIGNGGQILLNPTNGSSYWLTIVQSQQVASSRLRAIETDRWVLQVAPTGFSAIVDDDGRVLDRTGIGEQRVLHAEVPLRDGLTVAVRWGAWPTLAASLVLLAALHAETIASLTARGVRRRRGE